MNRFILILLCLLCNAGPAIAASMQQLEQLIEQRQFSSAIQTGEALLRAEAKQPRAQFLTAYAYQMAGQADKASALYASLIADHPELPEPRNNLAMIYLAQGDYDRASQVLVDAINTHPSYATAYDNLSRIYKGIASEAYRRAVSESSEPAKVSHDIQLVAITQLDSLAEASPAVEPTSEPTVVNFANQETLLIEQVKNWAEAWSNKQFERYASFYSPGYRSRFQTHADWLAHRRERILRPGEISVQISDIQIRWRSENRAIIDFRQAFQSPRYNDRVRKRLGFNRVGEEWKITEERVLSVL